MIRDYFKDFFVGMWEALKSVFTRLGWTGFAVCLMFAILLGWILPSCVHSP